MGVYDPLRSPFDMPLTMFRANCTLARAIELAERPGASPATLVRGAFGLALVNAGLGWLHEPRCDAQRRAHPSPVVVRVRPLRSGADCGAAVAALELAVALLGRKACESLDPVIAALRGSGREGLSHEGTRTPFTVETSARWAGTLGEWVRERSAGFGPDLAVELVTPLDRASPDLRGVLADAAHELVQWDLADSGLADQLGKQGCDPLAERARRHVAALLAGTQVSVNVERADGGRRRSRSNGGRFPLRGYVGRIALTAVPTEALPWLVVLEVRGAGRKTSYGLGEVRLSALT